MFLHENEGECSGKLQTISGILIAEQTWDGYNYNPLDLA